MSAINDGGSAFPFGDYTNEGEQGMSLRDYFAAAALSIAQANWQKHNDENNEGEEPAKSLVAEEAYEYADAMLAARKEAASE